MNVLLSTLVDKIRKRYSVQAYGNMHHSISSFALVEENGKTPLSRSTLYHVPLSYLYKPQGENVNIPVLCIVETDVAVDVNHMLSRPTIIIFHNHPVEVLVFLGQTLYELGQQSSAYAEFARALTGCQNLEELVHQGFLCLDNPLIVTDSARQVVAFTHPKHVRRWQHQLMEEEDFTQQQAEQNEYTHILFERSFLSDWPVSDDDGKLIFKTLTQNRRVLGFLYVFSYNRPFTGDDMTAVEILSRFVTIELLKRDASGIQKEDYDIQYLLGALLDGEYYDDALSLALADTWQSRLPRYKAIVVVELNEPDIQEAAALYSLRRQLTSAAEHIHGIVYRNTIVLLIGLCGDHVDREQDLSPIMPLLEKHRLHAGLSSPFTAISDSRNHYFQAEKAAHLGQVFYPGQTVHHYSQIAAYHMIELSSTYCELQSFCSPGLLRLAEYDRENDSQLADTLLTYIRSGLNKAETAKRLFVHQNTIKYRIAKIEEIIQTDLQDMDEVLALYNSYKILEYIRIGDTQDHYLIPPL